jgi:MATE family multidrug resistance protein
MPYYREARATLLLAVPIAIGQVSQMLMGVTDSVMIGRTGTVPLAASAFGVGIFNIFFIVGVGLLTPVAIFASRARGAGRHDEAGEYLRHGLLIALVFGHRSRSASSSSSAPTSPGSGSRPRCWPP